MKMRISHPVLRDFFDQLRFAPTPQKKKQLAASEHLLMILDTERQYPFDFVVYRITGYRPPEKPKQHLISGRDLMPDLRVWIAQLSAELQLDASEQGETIFTVEQLAARFAVSTKTIRRWQKRGLTGKIYVFQDGRKRMGFSASTVELFTKDHGQLVHRAGQFTLLTTQQKKQIGSLAQELTSKKNYRTQNELVLEIARQVDRSRQTVRAVLDELSRRQTASPVMPCSRGRMSSKETVKLYKMSQQNVSVKRLMELFGRSRSSIYRIINQRRAKELLDRKIEFISNEDFFHPDAEQLILSTPMENLLPKESAQSTLLSRQQETELFRRYNFLKFLASQQRSQIKRGQPRSDRLNHIETLVKQAEAVKKVIIETNMALVVSIAGKHLAAGGQMSELVSEGSVALMAAVEKFDYARGYRFSTYASWAIIKGFARMIPADKKRSLDPKIEYIDNPQFQEPNAKQIILSAPLEQLIPDKGVRSTPLSRQQEMELFRRYNYLKFIAYQEQFQAQRSWPKTERMGRIKELLKHADEVKKIIIEANMPLVISIAGKHLTTGRQMSELVSEGSIALMAAVEKFDFEKKGRGYRFSTYASSAIVNGFSRLILTEAKRLDRASGADFANLPVNLRFEQFPGIMAVEQAHRDLQTIIKNNLDQREQYIILNHYALDPGIIKKKPKTLKQIGDHLNLSKERIRQIELQALQKLRQSLSTEQFDLLTG